MNTKIPKSKDKTIVEIDYGKYTENVTIDKSNAEQFVKMIMSDHDIREVNLISGNSDVLLEYAEPKSTPRVEKIPLYQEEVSELEYRLNDWDERRYHESIQKKIDSYQEKEDRLISKMNLSELAYLETEYAFDLLSINPIGEGYSGIDELISLRNRYAVEKKSKGGEIDSVIERYKKVVSEGGFMNCELFCNKIHNDRSFKEFNKLPYKGVDSLKSGDVLQFGSDDNPRHYAIYLDGDKVLEVEAWGSEPREYSLSENIEEYEEISSIYRVDKKSKGGSVKSDNHFSGGLSFLNW